MASAAPAAGALPKVFVNRRLPVEVLAPLAAVAEVDCWPSDDPLPRAELLARVAPAEGLLTVLGERIDEELLAAAPHLRVVSSMGVGYDHVDVPALTRRRIPLGYTPGVVTNATAEIALALMLAVSRRLVEARAALLGERGPWAPHLLFGRELAGATLGIVGVGRIGEAVARRALAFEMEVLGHSRHPRAVPGVRFVPLAELLERSHFVSLHVPLTESTRHLIGAPELAAMRPDAVLINTARGAVVDHPALLDALERGCIAGAGLDVTDPEPLPPGHRLLALPSCLVLPHIGTATTATRAAMARLAVDNLLAGLAGRPLPACVNPEVLD